MGIPLSKHNLSVSAFSNSIFDAKSNTLFLNAEKSDVSIPYTGIDVASNQLSFPLFSTLILSLLSNELVSFDRLFKYLYDIFIDCKDNLYFTDLKENNVIIYNCQTKRKGKIILGIEENRRELFSFHSLSAFCVVLTFTLSEKTKNKTNNDLKFNVNFWILK